MMDSTVTRAMCDTLVVTTHDGSTPPVPLWIVPSVVAIGVALFGHLATVKLQKQHHRRTEAFNAWRRVEVALDSYEGWLQRLLRVLAQLQTGSLTGGIYEGAGIIQALFDDEDRRRWRAEAKSLAGFIPVSLVDDIERVNMAEESVHIRALIELSSPTDKTEYHSHVQEARAEVKALQDELNAFRPRWREEVHAEVFGHSRSKGGTQ